MNNNETIQYLTDFLDNHKDCDTDVKNDLKTVLTRLKQGESLLEVKQNFTGNEFVSNILALLTINPYKILETDKTK